MCAVPVQCPLHQLTHYANHIINRPDQLFRRITLPINASASAHTACTRLTAVSSSCFAPLHRCVSHVHTQHTQTYTQSRASAQMACPVRHYARIASQSTCSSHPPVKRCPPCAVSSLSYVSASMSDKQSHAHTSLTRGSNSSLALSGTISTLVGATTGGSESTCAWSDTLTMVKMCLPRVQCPVPDTKTSVPKECRGYAQIQTRAR